MPESFIVDIILLSLIHKVKYSKIARSNPNVNTQISRKLKRHNNLQRNRRFSFENNNFWFGY